MRVIASTVATILTALIISGCSQTNSRYSQRYDSAPTRLPTAAELENATPVQEPYSDQGNRDYQVFGKRYQVLDSAEGFVETGLASWYGNKFHGHLTSNGEYYDMYSMTAAHKHLPLPSYVRVTNLENNKSVIVRVNDRGPFHPRRIIDLSFAAAYKLEMLDNGTAKVQVKAVNFKTPLASTEFYIQLFASSNANKVDSVKQDLPKNWQINATTQKNQGLYKLLLGPFPQAQANRKLNTVRAQGFPRAFRVKNLQIKGPETDAVEDK
ncbi:septal ring lytic transglycosylase RlpA family protein [Idiomarina seosinensis]|uniref:Endolytic peptidoglycan transglycosylase RlpA n=1 Tax=Idiomarina seosinensis TaxID=281739 RepID=A0A432ZGX2_9GAMM|nr:septal ring lytic transglycosylase RlpA family protein [Idiomarina seosinensis]RUO77218.1 septal ring lytic transglycosylase RlpA [Idiomarina seosinensis]